MLRIFKRHRDGPGKQSSVSDLKKITGERADRLGTIDFIFLSLFIVLILLGGALRFWHLDRVPFGLDSDQANVLSWGHHSLENRQFQVYADESTDFEALSSLFFAATEKVWGNARPLSALLSLLDFFLLGLLLVRRKTSLFLTTSALVLLATNPFAVYYARVAGPCVGASTLLLLFCLMAHGAKNSLWKQSLGLALGLLYYSIFRILFVYEVAAGLIQRSFRRVTAAVVAFFVVVLASLVTRHGGSQVQLRGLYNLPGDWTELGRRVQDWISLWWGAPSSRFVQPMPGFTVDPVTEGFAWALGSAPALGVGMSFLFALSWLQWMSERCPLPDFPRRFFLFAFLALILSPTFSHAIWVLPLLCFFTVLAFERLLKPGAKMRTSLQLVLGTAILISGISGLAQSYSIFDRLQTRGQLDRVFGDSLRKLFEDHMGSDREGLPIFFFTGQQYDLARYWGRRFPRVQIYPGFPVDESLLMLRRYVEPGQSMIVYFDIQELGQHWAYLPEAQEQMRLVKELENRLRARAEILSLDEIQEFGHPVARRYVIRWGP